MKTIHIMLCLAFLKVGFCDTQLITLPVNVYRYSFEINSSIDATISKGEIEKQFDAVNKVWSQASIKWDIKSVQDKTVPKTIIKRIDEPENRRVWRKKMAFVAPKREKGVWNVVYIHHFPMKQGKGLYMPEAQTVVMSQAAHGVKTRDIILAHELGHSLGLKHITRGGPCLNENLLCGKDGGEKLTAKQIESARTQAKKEPFERVY